MAAVSPQAPVDEPVATAELYSSLRAKLSSDKVVCARM
jgi:hypothetical protein